MIDQMSRPAGVVSSSFASRCTPTFALVVSIVGDSPFTVMLSVTAPTLIVKSTGVVPPTLTVTPSRVMD